VEKVAFGSMFAARSRGSSFVFVSFDGITFKGLKRSHCSKRYLGRLIGYYNVYNVIQGKIDEALEC
jgi:hypothetical protein